MADTPETLLEAVTYFSDLDRATQYVASIRWPEGFVCPSWVSGALICVCDA